MANERSAGRKLAIVGFWEGNRNLAPFPDPDYEIWSLNHLHPYIPRWDVWFDMHKPEWSAQNMKPEVWKDQDRWLRESHGKPIYMLEHYDAYPDSIAYPVEAVSRRFKPYFTNGIAYMLGLALLQHVEGSPISRLELWAWTCATRRSMRSSAHARSGGSGSRLALEWTCTFPRRLF